MKRIAPILFVVACLAAAEIIPPAPKQWFNDYANAVSPATAQRLNRQLEDFERATSSQFVVAVFPKMESTSSIEDYCHRMFQAWKIGQQGKNNGVALFVFVQDRRMRVEVGYGLEGALPDVIAKRIIEDEIGPHFRNGDFDGGLNAGITAIIQATKGEYKGTGQLHSSDRVGWFLGRFVVNRFFPWNVFLLFVVLGMVQHFFRARAIIYSRRGLRAHRWMDWIQAWAQAGRMSSSRNDWDSGGFGGGGGGGGGFSGGGGSSGGGGASGSW